MSGKVIRLAQTDEEILRCFAVLRELRPALQLEGMVDRVRAQQKEGYRMAMLETDGEVSTVAGFRVFGMLATGRTMYVDDLVTAAAARSRGHGKAMLEWLMQTARAEGCQSFSLDSGTQRQDAHAFYLRERMRITSFHLFRAL